MQSVSSRIWTRVAVSISYDDNDYTMGILLLIRVLVIIIIIIIKLDWWHGFLWVFLTIHPCQLSLLVGSQDCIQCLCKVFAGQPKLVCLQKNVTTEFVTASLAVPNVSCSSWMVCEMVFCEVLLPGFVQNSMQHPCVVFI